MSFLDKIREWVCGIVHHDDFIEVEVVKGDTLWDIAKKASGATDNADVQRHVEEVIAINPDLDPDVIRPGDKIKLPTAWGE